MLSNQTSDLQRQHRRQYSTPTANDSLKVPLLPATPRQYGLHRRGLSLDQRTPQQQPQRHQSLQDDRTVSTNQGSQQQHILREAQQQRLARPGQYQEPLSNHVSEHQQCHSPRKIQPAKYQDAALATYPERQYITTSNDRNIYKHTDFSENNITLNFDSLTPFESTSPGGNLNSFGRDIDELVEYLHYDGSEVDRNLSETYDMSERPSLHASAKEVPQRPCTPPGQSSSSYFPITPAPTPFTRSSKTHGAPRSRTTQSSPVRKAPNKIVKASHATTMKRGSSCQEFFEDVEYQLRSPGLPSPPNTAPLSFSSTFDMVPVPAPNFMNMSALKMDFSANENGYDSSHYSPMSKDVSPTMSSFQSSPELAHMDLFGDIGDAVPDFSMPAHQSRLLGSKSAMDLGSYSLPIKEEPLPRSQSISELSLDPPIDASIEDTGITVDEIASFIQGPDPNDGKWACLFPDCNKKFGRKENIKSHVQTHLGDRQFRCNHCKKCFVRQHDLKRHAKIHSGVKPYPCACGNSFARHDALTRHRQRNMCIGAFEGMMKKEIKRGRPKKMNRPDTEERQEKAARTRRRVLEKSYASSMSGSSESSFPSPPATYDDMEMNGESPFDDLQAMEPMSYGVSPDVFSYTPPTSPGYSTGNCFSPHHSQQSYTPKAVSMSPSPKRGSITSIPEDSECLFSGQPSPSKSAASQYGTPPELDNSSSSPATSKFFDFDCTSEAAEHALQSAGSSQSKESSASFGIPDMGHSVNQMFYDSFGDETLMTSLERDPTLLLDKLEDPFPSGNGWVDEYTQSSNSFFGSP